MKYRLEVSRCTSPSVKQREVRLCGLNAAMWLDNAPITLPFDAPLGRVLRFEIRHDGELVETLILTGGEPEARGVNLVASLAPDVIEEACEVLDHLDRHDDEEDVRPLEPPVQPPFDVDDSPPLVPVGPTEPSVFPDCCDWR